MITPYFFLKIEKPFIGFLNNVLSLFTGAYYPNATLGTSHNSILPSVAKDNTL
jgi:hypothetical protein